MAATAEIRTLKWKMEQAQETLARIEWLHGKDCEDYKIALRQFAAAWYVLKETRHASDFIKEIC